MTAHRAKKAPRRWRGTLPLTVGACACALALGLPGTAAAGTGKADPPPTAGSESVKRPALPERPRMPGKPALPERPDLPEKPTGPNLPGVPADLEDLMEAVEGLSASPLTNLGVADPFWLNEIDREIETVLGEDDGGKEAADWPVGPARLALKKELQRLQTAALNGDVLAAADAKTKIPKLTDDLLQAAGLGSFLDQVPPPPEPDAEDVTGTDEPVDSDEPGEEEDGAEDAEDSSAEPSAPTQPSAPPVLPPPVPS
ncbi:hypothetical protein ABT367_34915, partial [Streptomyces mesophilus]